MNGLRAGYKSLKFGYESAEFGWVRNDRGYESTYATFISVLPKQY